MAKACSYSGSCLGLGVPPSCQPKHDLLDTMPVGMAIWVRILDIRRVPDPTGSSTGTIFTHGWHPNPTWTETGTGRVFFPPAGNPTGIRGYPRVSDTLLPLWFYVVSKWKCVHFVILTMTCCDYWTLLLGYLKYLLNINFKYMYIVFHSLNWLFWFNFYMWNDKPDGYSIPIWNPIGMGTNFYPRV
jgi:hypothetical protein